ncbi:MAG: aromatic ring-hydroxylating dioxygenase subunit alpha [Pseudomonadota bacterium]|nr:aromatic ring-hydroxylating dioxygenase subunit alpha [Pseudomonadota bacterium]
MNCNSDLKSVLKNIGNAKGLPNAHYIDNAAYEEEKNALIFNKWAGLAVASDIPSPGDAIPITFFGMPLLLLRDKIGKVRVFLNTCRHRGMILVEKAQKVNGAIRCPYHSWCYSTEGKLISTPHVGGPGHNTHKDIEKDTLGLTQIRSHLWRDVVWINVNGNSVDFASAMAEVINRWSDFEQPLHHGGNDSSFRLIVNCNWKLAVENYCESYHLPWVHPDLNTYSRLQDHYNIENPGSFSGQGTLLYKQIRGKDNETFTDFKNIQKRWLSCAEYLAIYPNVLLGVHRDHAFSIILTPQGTEKTSEKVDIYYATGNTNKDLRRKNTAQWKKVFEEDIFVVEGMQRGRHATSFDGGKFSPVMDGPTHCFHHWAAHNIMKNRKDNND